MLFLLIYLLLLLQPPRQSQPIFYLANLIHAPFPPSPPPLTDSGIESGFRESEEGESSLIVVLDSLIPFIRDKNASIKLPTYLGKAIHNSAGNMEESTSKVQPGESGKEFSWSWGIGIELSPIKTRSTRKKLAQKLTQTDVTVPPSTDSGALRALKALARTK
jgi:hypothetical protein